MDVSTNTSSRLLTDDPDFTVLPDQDTDARYLTLLKKAFRLLGKCEVVRGTDSAVTSDTRTYEMAFIEKMTQRLINTVDALHMKHAYGVSETGDRLYVDTTESGMPNHLDISATQVDLIERDVLLDTMASHDALKRHALDILFKEGAEPQRVLGELGRRSYLEMLHPEKLFLPFVMGPLAPWQHGKATKGRGYLIGWGCYDIAKNLPYVHIMYFEQDVTEFPLEEGGENLHKLVRVIQSEGSRVPEKLNILGAAIDEALDPIHPKLLKRIRIGPLYAPLFLKDKPEPTLTDREIVLNELFGSDSDEDFALFFREEIVFSVKQRVNPSLFKKIVREAFYVPPLDQDAYEAGSSYVRRNILMPHRMLQHMNPDQALRLGRLNERYGYDTQEKIHEIS